MQPWPLLGPARETLETAPKGLLAVFERRGICLDARRGKRFWTVVEENAVKGTVLRNRTLSLTPAEEYRPISLDARRGSRLPTPAEEFPRRSRARRSWTPPATACVVRVAP